MLNGKISLKKTFPFNMFCNKCNINWARLAAIDDGYECYEFCPKCKSDMDLVESKPGPSFICLPDGKIINWITKQPLLTSITPPPAMPAKATTFSMDEWQASKDQARQEDDARIAHYIHIYETQGEKEALQSYTNYKRQ